MKFPLRLNQLVILPTKLGLLFSLLHSFWWLLQILLPLSIGGKKCKYFTTWNFQYSYKWIKIIGIWVVSEHSIQCWDSDFFLKIKFFTGNQNRKYKYQYTDPWQVYWYLVSILVRSWLMTAWQLPDNCLTITWRAGAKSCQHYFHFFRLAIIPFQKISKNPLKWFKLNFVSPKLQTP